MSAPDYFGNVRGAVHDFSLLQTRLVVIVGVGMTGSQVADWLAQCGVGHLRFIDHDVLELENLPRHVLDERYLGKNKAKALAHYLGRIDGLDTEAIPHEINGSMADDLDDWLSDADLIIAATDRQDVQRIIGQCALRLGIEALFPALFLDGGGEIVVQFDAQLPCFSCWDEFRPPDRPVRGPALLPHTALPVIYVTLRLSLGLLDRNSPDRAMLSAGPGRPPYQMFGINHLGILRSGHLTRNRTCPACGGGPTNLPPPAPLRPPTPIPIAVPFTWPYGAWRPLDTPPPATHRPQPTPSRPHRTNPVLPFIAGLLQLISGGVAAVTVGFIGVVLYLTAVAALLLAALWLCVVVLGYLFTGHLIL